MPIADLPIYKCTILRKYNFKTKRFFLLENFTRRFDLKIVFFPNLGQRKTKGFVLNIATSTLEIPIWHAERPRKKNRHVTPLNDTSFLAGSIAGPWLPLNEVNHLYIYIYFNFKTLFKFPFSNLRDNVNFTSQFFVEQEIRNDRVANFELKNHLYLK